MIFQVSLFHASAPFPSSLPLHQMRVYFSGMKPIFFRARSYTRLYFFWYFPKNIHTAPEIIGGAENKNDTARGELIPRSVSKYLSRYFFFFSFFSASPGGFYFTTRKTLFRQRDCEKKGKIGKKVANSLWQIDSRGKLFHRGPARPYCFSGSAGPGRGEQYKSTRTIKIRRAHNLGRGRARSK